MKRIYNLYKDVILIALILAFYSTERFVFLYNKQVTRHYQGEHWIFLSFTLGYLLILFNLFLTLKTAVAKKYKHILLEQTEAFQLQISSLQTQVNTLSYKLKFEKERMTMEKILRVEEKNRKKDILIEVERNLHSLFTLALQHKGSIQKTLILIKELLNTSFLKKIFVSQEDLNTLIAHSIKSSKPKAYENNIRISYTLSEISEIHTDAHLFKIFLSNLIMRSLERTPKNGHIKVCAGKDSHHLNYFLIHLEDNGFNFEEPELLRFFKYQKKCKETSELLELKWQDIQKIIHALGGEVIKNTLDARGKRVILKFPLLLSPLPTGSSKVIKFSRREE